MLHNSRFVKYHALAGETGSARTASACTGQAQAQSATERAEIARLERENARLRKQLEQTHALLDLRNCCGNLGYADGDKHRREALTELRYGGHLIIWLLQQDRQRP